MKFSLPLGSVVAVCLCVGVLSAQVPIPGYTQLDCMYLPDSVLFGDSSFTATPWPNGVVPYAFDSNVSSLNQDRAREAMAEWEAVANVTFVARTNEVNYIKFQDGSGNSSYVGMIGGMQELTMYNWNYKYVICHELKHALGFLHEQSRPDRDTYVTINSGNICCNAGGNFTIVNGATTVGPYDFESIMHYSDGAFANGGGNTIDCKPAYSQFQNVMGNRNYMTVLDAEGVANRYGAPQSPQITGVSPTSAAPGSSFTLTVDGSRFSSGSPSSSGVQGSRIIWNGSPVSTTWVNSTQLTAVIPASLSANAGCYSVLVENAYPAGGLSNSGVVEVGTSCGAAAQYALNSPEATFTFSGSVAGGALGPKAQRAYIGGEQVLVNFGSTLSGAPWDGLLQIAPVIGASAGGFVTPGGQILNLDLFTTTLYYFTTGSPTPGYPASAGNLQVPFAAPMSPIIVSMQMVVVDGSTTDGFRVSQAGQADVVGDLCSTGVSVSLGDDDSVAMVLGAPFSFAGTSYTELYVGSNGSMTFGSGNTDFSPTVAEFLQDEPRVAAMWVDMDPTSGGGITFGTASGGQWAVCFTAVPLWGSTDTLDFSIVATASDISMTYGAALPSLLGIAGVSLGNGAGSSQAEDLSVASGLTFSNTTSVFEEFSGVVPDLSGMTIRFGLDGSGFPVSLN